MAIVHLIRTEVLIQSEQTQEVVLIKLLKSSKHRNIIQQRKDARKSELNHRDPFEIREAEETGSKKQTEGQKQKTFVSMSDYYYSSPEVCM